MYNTVFVRIFSQRNLEPKTKSPNLWKRKGRRLITLFLPLPLADISTVVKLIQSGRIFSCPVPVCTCIQVQDMQIIG